MKNNSENKSVFSLFLNQVEKVGNRLPDPIILFFSLCIVLAITTAVVAQFDTAVKHPGTGKIVEVRSILSHDGFMMFMNDAIKNFSQFPALGIVLSVMIGIGIAEKSGYFDKLMIHIVSMTSERILLPTIIFVGILGNIAGDAAPIVLPPLVAMIFLKLGYHPIAGLALAYTATLGGFAANLFIGMQDALVYAFTEPSAHLIREDMTLNVAMNWYFIAASVVILIPILWFVTKKIVIPHLGTYDHSQMAMTENDDTAHVTPQEKRALFWANISFVVTLSVIAIIAIPENSWLRHPQTHSLIEDSPLMNGIGLIIILTFLIPGLVYGILAKTIQSSKDIGQMLTDSMGTMGNFIVIVFFAAQLLGFLTWSHLGIVIAVKGAELLQDQNGVLLIVGLLVLSGLINMLIGSASAKWALLGPIFVPMLLLLGFHPAFTQMIYRVGDSITNPITPMMPYLPLLLTYAQKYDPKMKLGSLIASLMPYSIFLGIFWTLFLIIWYLLGIPVGPGGPIHV
ncbi:AbgT family transporter [Staphylococcus intermedius]|uniref:Transporter n=1 Tax=Staphylococcus intermedius NCTC 11048 TaxID=1141106 RepID=A0A380G580_STAIN|nr:AbgT family transporter [Staphylococcus intermedius]PCF63806.1 aminobenzoyl-glutamate transporter [Staphylococcus intermedius]PCF78521.1 aminobenzoyl-glutamate transporter [Staphylococcus intermedius]PCF79494.1 aminobenzoyl-glutamate transporter [Staphylococcus intermedius]PCF86769.1 aminobenzoyl-glutamate transporter [Staphylococcus intermedius]PCF89848.1 aminobenzoyl-glutamate transporter [Staphylococcus intermedius]